MVAGGDAGGGKGWVERNSFFSLSLSLSLSLFLLGGWIYTHLTEGRRSVHCFRYRPFHSAPNTRPLVLSFRRIFTGSPPHAHAHTISYTLCSLFHPRTFFLSFSPLLASRFIYAFTLRIFFFHLLLFSLFSHLHSRAFTFVVFSYSATFKYRIFRNN